jgi:hypothetical protein
MRRRRVTAGQRAEVARRANGCCEYCRCPQRFCPDTFSIDHILPKARRGRDELSNLAFACQGCNNAKYDHTTARDPTTGVTVRLFNPRLDRWTEHFEWAENFTRVVGITAIGRATIDLLRLNRPQVQELRKLLHAAAFHPPQEQ